MNKKGKMLSVYSMIEKECSRNSLLDLCEQWGVTEGDFYDFLNTACRCQTEDEPLSKDTVLQMHGQPVWVKDLFPTPSDISHWGIVDVNFDCPEYFGIGAVISPGPKDMYAIIHVPLSEYGEKWVAYTQKPKRDCQ